MPDFLFPSDVSRLADPPKGYFQLIVRPDGRLATMDEDRVIRDAAGDFRVVTSLDGLGHGATVRSGLLQHGTFSSDPGDRRIAIAPTLAYEDTAVQEPSVWYANGSYHMLYTASYGAHRLAYASAPSLAGPWTKNPTFVLGGGVGGVAGGVYHGNLFRENGVLYYWFVEDTDNTLLKLATASESNPLVWTLNARTYPLVGSADLWGNTYVVKDGSTYYMLFEQSIPGVSWQLGVGVLSGGPTGALTSTVFPLTTPRPSATNGTATVCGPWAIKEGSRWVMYYHCGRAGSLPTEIYRAFSTNIAADAWTIDNQGFPIITRQGRWEVDQVADIDLCQDVQTGDWYAFWTAMDNDAPAARIMWAPVIPGLVRNISGQWYMLGGESQPNYGQHLPQPINAIRLASDFTTTSTSLVNVTGMSIAFIPRGTRAVARLVGTGCNGTADAATRFAITDGGSQSYRMGAFNQYKGGFQTPFMGACVMTGLIPGQRYIFNLQVEVGSGTFFCRPVTLPNEEQMVLTIDDANWPRVNG